MSERKPPPRSVWVDWESGVVFNEPPPPEAGPCAKYIRRDRYEMLTEDAERYRKVIALLHHELLESHRYLTETIELNPGAVALLRSIQNAMDAADTQMLLGYQKPVITLAGLFDE